jgi:hypothetical protein
MALKLRRWLLYPLLVAGIFQIGATIHYYQTPVEEAHPGWERPAFGAEYSADLRSWSYQDFAAHYAFARGAWHRVAERPYTEDGQKAIYAWWLGKRPPAGNPPCYAPTLLWLGGALMGFPDLWAYVVFAGTGLVLLGCCWRWVLAPALDSWALVFLVVLPFCSLAYVSVLSLGQSSIGSTGLFGFALALVYDLARRCRRTPGSGQEILLGFLLFVLSAKPSLAATLGVFLLATGQWRPVAGAVLAFGASTWFLAPYTGGFPTNLLDYARVVSGYNPGAAATFFGPFVEPGNYTNFQSALIMGAGVDATWAGRVSNVLWLVGNVALVGLGWRHPHWDRGSVFQATVLFFLMFCPAVNGAEDIILGLWVLGSPVLAERRFFWPTAVLLLLAVNSSPRLGLLAGTARENWPICFLAKLGLGILWFYALKSHDKAVHKEPVVA